jgi:hypothetical protein
LKIDHEALAALPEHFADKIAQAGAVLKARTSFNPDHNGIGVRINQVHGWSGFRHGMYQQNG